MPLNCLPEIVYVCPRDIVAVNFVTFGAQAAFGLPWPVYSVELLPRISTWPVGRSTGAPPYDPSSVNFVPSNSYSPPNKPNTSTSPLGSSAAYESPALSPFGMSGPAVHFPDFTL